MAGGKLRAEGRAGIAEIVERVTTRGGTLPNGSEGKTAPGTVLATELGRRWCFT